MGNSSSSKHNIINLDTDSSDSDCFPSPYFSSYGFQHHSTMPTRGRASKRPAVEDSHLSQEPEGNMNENLAPEISVCKYQSTREDDSLKKGHNESDMEVPYFDPTSWVWKGKPNATFAVVIDNRPESKSHLMEKSASSQNVSGVGKLNNKRTQRYAKLLEIRGKRRSGRDLCKEDHSTDRASHLFAQTNNLNSTSQRYFFKATKTHKFPSTSTYWRTSEKMAEGQKRPLSQSPGMSSGGKRRRQDGDVAEWEDHEHLLRSGSNPPELHNDLQSEQADTSMEDESEHPQDQATSERGSDWVSWDRLFKETDKRHRMTNNLASASLPGIPKTKKQRGASGPMPSPNNSPERGRYPRRDRKQRVLTAKAPASAFEELDDEEGVDLDQALKNLEDEDFAQDLEDPEDSDVDVSDLDEEDSHHDSEVWSEAEESDNSLAASPPRSRKKGKAAAKAPAKAQSSQKAKGRRKPATLEEPSTRVPNQQHLASLFNIEDINSIIPPDPEGPFVPDDPDAPASDAWKDNVAKLGDRFDAASFYKGPNKNLAPISKTAEMFQDLVERAKSDENLKKAVEHLKQRKLRVATMCSGTESPVIAIKQIFQYLREEFGLDHEKELQYEHVFSAEIVPFKQAFIELNFAPKLLFRDIIEMAQSKDNMATTAFGARKKIPGGVDVLIAGFSCVDMSNLNGHKLTLEQMGESGDTLEAILTYVVKYEVPIVILENLDSAPWERNARKPNLESISDKFLERGYYCQAVHLDTKNFYIPHTRQRGYMVCVRMDKILRNPFNKEDTKEYVKLAKEDKLLESAVMKLSRPASEPVEAFLLPENDRRIVRSIHDASQPGNVRAVNWGTCEATHTTYRRVVGLGQKKPLTNWTLGGSCLPHSALPAEWVRNSVERVKESIDMQWLRSLGRGYDSLYKNRMVDLSQNIDRRSMDLTGSGFTGCVTPLGMPFGTAVGRMFVAEEALKLQGMDPDKLNVSLLTQAQLRDLAGNAMSCPVVGTVILTTIMMLYKAIPPNNPEEIDEVTSKSDKTILLECNSEQKSFEEIVLGPQNIHLTAQFLAHIECGVQHCSCEGCSGFQTMKLLECLDCGHKACMKHSHNPCHNYKSVAPGRVDPREVLSALYDKLPMSLRFKFNFEEVENAVKDALEKTPLCLHDRYKGALRSVNEFPPLANSDDIKKILEPAKFSDVHFKDIERSARGFKCKYESQDEKEGALRIELVFNAKGIEWLVFAKVPRAIANNSPLRELLDQPIGRMRPNVKQDDVDFTKGQWEFRLPSQESFSVSIQGIGNCKPCFECTQGLPSFEAVTVWDTLDIKTSRQGLINGYDISGEYTLHQECGAPMGTLYKKNGKIPVYLTLHPTRYDHPDFDEFIFTTEVWPLKFKELRIPLARLHRTWRPNSGEQNYDHRPKEYKDENNKICKLSDLEILGKDLNYQPSTENSPIEVECFVDGEWAPIKATLGTEAEGKFCALSKFEVLSELFSKKSPSEDPSTEEHYLQNSASCHRAIKVLDVVVKAGNLSISDTDNEWVTLKGQDLQKLMNDVAWLTKRIAFNDSQECSPEGWHDVILPVFHGCSTCAVPVPDVKWRLQKLKWTNAQKAKVKAGKIAEIPKLLAGDNDIPEAYEDPEANIKFELASKARPSAFVVKYWKFVENLKLQMGINVQPLIHRAAAALPKADARRSGQLLCSYRLSVDYDPTEKADLPGFTIPSNESNNADAKKPARKPPNFAFSLQPYQAISLSWAIDQEKIGNIRVKEERIREETLPSLGWRVEGRASREVPVRGGILADQVGYGKTAIILGLFDSQFDLQPAPVADGSTGRIGIKATIIFVPSHLVAQWRSEVTKFLGTEKYKHVLAIHSVEEWKKYTISHFMEADLIICSWTVLGDDAYLDRVADLSGMLAYPKTAGIRAQKAWHAAAREGLPEVVKALVSGEELTTLRDKLADRFASNWDEAESNSSSMPSFRLRGAARRKQKELEQQRQQETQASGMDINFDKTVVRNAYLEEDDLGLKDLRGFQDFLAPPFELFHFHRKVVDEYTYTASRESDVIAHIRSNCTWLLSGTPGLKDFSDVWRLLKWLDLDLGEPELTPGFIHATNIKMMALEQTSSEKFRTYLNPQSFAMSKYLHEYGQQALNLLARQNMTPFDAHPKHHHIRPVDLPPVDRAIYSELALTVAGSDMREKKPVGIFKKLHRESLVKSIWTADKDTKAPTSAVAALMMCNLANPGLDLNVLLKKRSDHLREATETFLALIRACWFRLATLSSMGKDAKWQKEQKSHYINFEERMRRNEAADPVTSAFILKEMKRYEQLPDELQGLTEQDFRLVKNKELPLLRALSNQLRNACKVLSAAQRGDRFIRSVAVLHRNNPVADDQRGCSHVGQEENDGQLTSYAVLPECGHLYCKSCVDTMKENNSLLCTKTHCVPPTASAYMVKKDEFMSDTLPGGVNAKMLEIANLIKRIKDGDKVLLFTQFSTHRTKIEKALKDQGISIIVLEKHKMDPAAALIKFRDGGAKVLVLSIDDVSAAGSNLTVANHVIFAFPYLTLSQSKFDAAMTQAIGRVCRMGQEKAIHIYHFLTLKTADVDVFEARRNAILVHDSNLPAGINIDDSEWDEAAFVPQIKNWQPSGFHMVKRTEFPSLGEGLGYPKSGAYSSQIHDQVVVCMDKSLEDDDGIDAEEGEDDGGEGED